MADGKGIPTETVFASVNEWFEAFAPIFIPLTILGVAISLSVFIYQAIKTVLSEQDKPPQPEPSPSSPAVSVQFDWVELRHTFWRIMYPLLGWGQYDKEKRDRVLGLDGEGNPVYRSDFENDAGAEEWLRSNGGRTDERR